MYKQNVFLDWKKLQYNDSTSYHLYNNRNCSYRVLFADSWCPRIYSSQSIDTSNVSLSENESVAVKLTELTCFLDENLFGYFV